MSFSNLQDKKMKSDESLNGKMSLKEKNRNII